MHSCRRVRMARHFGKNLVRVDDLRMEKTWWAIPTRRRQGTVDLWSHPFGFGPDQFLSYGAQYATKGLTKP